jgi:hypothetical protein
VVVKRFAVLLAACAETHPPKPPPPLSLDAWLKQCVDQIDVARRAVEHMDHELGTSDGELSVNSTRFHPSVTLAMGFGDASFRMVVERGRAPCDGALDGDEEMPWDNDVKGISPSTMRVSQGTRVFIDVTLAGEERGLLFIREMRRAGDACVRTGRGVVVEDIPRGVRCREEEAD